MLTKKDACGRAGQLGGLRRAINRAHRTKNYAKRNALMRRYDDIRLARMREQ